MLMKNSNAILTMVVHFYTIKICAQFFGHVHMRTKIFRSCAHVHMGGEHKKAWLAVEK